MSDAQAMTRQQVRAVDGWAIDEVGIPGTVLMENAGRSATDLAQRLLGGVSAPRVAVLAGSGNNGGDGFVIARHLRLRGVQTDTYLLADPAKITGDAAVNFNVLQRLGAPLIECAGRSADELTELWRPYDLLVDALGGTGVTGALRGNLAAAVTAANATGTKILAIDIPTGLDCDTGRTAGPCIRAAATITFVARKVGFDAPTAAAYTGEVLVAGIGVPVANG